MAGSRPTPDPLETGPFGTVEYAVRTNGAIEAQEWLEEQTEKIQASFGVLFRRLVDHGRISNKTQFRHLRDEVWEFKRGGNRILCYRLANRYLLTHQFKKGGRKCPVRQIDRALNIGREHIQREMSQRKKRKPRAQ